MTIHQQFDGAGIPAAGDVSRPLRLRPHWIGKTPAGIQRRHLLKRRRTVFAFLNVATWFALILWLGTILRASGWSGIDIAIMSCFALAAPWGVLGIWNALTGLWLLYRRQAGRRNWLAQVAPYAAAGKADAPIRSRTAIVMTICNEAPERAIARLAAVRDSLERTSAPEAYDYFILSDTNDDAIAAVEAREFARWQEQAGLVQSAAAGAQPRLVYRRRDRNSGFKAGNIRDFCERWGSRYDFFLPLDADSLMSGETIERMVRICQAWPRIGILQSLVVGAPSNSLFARIFQFGMRQGMRPYAIGSAWWNGDCGQYWGHNALVRTEPFLEHCELPELPEGALFGERILSHDQVEAVLMRKAGYEVRVLPIETGSWEDNPPDLLEFMQRDTRWCQGNLQYVHLLGMKNIEPTSRFQLIWAVMMFLNLPAWTSIIALIALKPLDGEPLTGVTAISAIGFYVFFLLMFLAPKLAGYADIALTRGELARYGGGLRFAVSATFEIVFSFLLAAVVSFRTSIFMAGLLFGKQIRWGGQHRDARSMRFATAASALWPHLLFGLAIYAIAMQTAPQLILWSLPLTLGYVLAIPFAIAGASPRLGALAARRRICAIPEDFNLPPVLAQMARADGLSGDASENNGKRTPAIATS